MSNKLYEFGGTADVILKSRIEQTINGVTYAANEPYTVFKDVSVELQYDSYTTNGAGGISNKTNLSIRQGQPTKIALFGCPLTDKVCNLIFTQEKETTYTETCHKTLVCLEDGKLHLTTSNIQSMFVYDDEYNKVGVFAASDIAEQCVTGNFVAGRRYLVFQTLVKTGKIYKFDMPIYPYFSLEIIGKGNTDKKTSGVYLNFDAVSLVSTPALDIISGGMLNAPLVFDIIYKNQKEPVIVLK